ncbi:MAG TPA: twin-arginine translocase TatA/TatE family subunit [Solirubrobacteraceae bacterium]|jgi:TatA/E family protein of Tat protein translocase|nr:twin-arginine translocase TatA/TatE family subunit [Solirubrobacteraceae bacterium]
MAMGIENPVHLLFIAAVALIVLGPKRLPEVAKALGHGIREFREAINQPAAEREQPPAAYQHQPASYQQAPVTYQQPAVAPEPPAAGPADGVQSVGPS